MNNQHPPIFHQPHALRKITQAFTRAFAANEIKQREQGMKKDESGRWVKNYVDYIEGNNCIDRLNEAVTPLGWTFTIIKDEVHNYHPDHPGDAAWPSEVEVHGRLTIFTPWGEIWREGYGSNAVKYQEVKEYDPAQGKKVGTGRYQVMAIVEDKKGAATDALKKCATQLGIYNHGYRKGTAATSEEVKPVIEQIYARAKALQLTKQQTLDFMSGVCRKTILAPGDLNFTQAQICLLALQQLQAPQDALALPGAEDDILIVREGGQTTITKSLSV